MRSICITDYQWLEIEKALKKRLQYLRAGERRFGEHNLEKRIAIEAVLNTAASVDYCSCCGNEPEKGCKHCDPTGVWCSTCSCQH